MPLSTAATTFVGRRAELAVLAACAAQASSGVPWLVLVEGEGGIGKTALLREAVARLEKSVLWWAGCDESGRDWPFSAVKQWLRCADSELVGRFPALTSGLEPEVSPLAVGQDLVALLGSLQNQAPVVLVLDDAQWADDASVQALGFVLRRLVADRILVLATARTPTAGTDGGIAGERWQRLAATVQHSRRLRLGALSVNEVMQLTRAVTHRSDSRRVATRLWEHTGGHPLYMRAVLTTTGAGGLSDPSTPLPVPETVTAAIVSLLDRLPAPSRALVEALAVLEGSVPLGVAGQVAQLGNPSEALEPLLDAGLVEWSPAEVSAPVRISHRLQRQAVYLVMSPLDRRAMHAAAADIVDANHSWSHRVSAAGHTDPELAGALEREAARLQRANQAARAATLLEWAADLSPSRALHESRLLAAAVRLNNSGYYDAPRALALRGRVERCAPSALRSCLQARYAYRNADYSAAVRIGHRALAEAEAEGAHEVVGLARTWLGSSHLAAGDFRQTAALLPSVLNDETTDPDLVFEAGWTLPLAVLFDRGPHAGLRAIQEIKALPDDPTSVGAADSGLLTWRGVCRGKLGNLRSGCQDLLAVLALNGAPPLTRIQARYNLAHFQYLLGEWDRAATNVEQALTEADVMGLRGPYAPCHYTAVAVAAGQGRWHAAREHLRACRQPIPMSALFGAVPHLAGAVLAAARGDLSGVHQALWPLAGPDPWPADARMYENEIRPLWTQALIAEGPSGPARAAVADLRELSTRVHGLRLTYARTAGLLAEAERDPRKAIRIYRDALGATADADDPPMDRAALEHTAGRLCARLRERRASHEFLQLAHQHYTALGATPYAERVAADLPTHQEVPPLQTPAGLELTDRESTIAHLAADGLTNQEIAGRLFVSAKTVEYHLGHVYTKLGLASRRQLRTALSTTS